MKNKLIILAMLALSAGFVAFTAQKDSGELTKVSVVHHEGNQVIVLDTVFDPATGYTVDQFLLDHGMNPDETDIINTDDMDGAHVHNLGHDVWFLESECSGDNVQMIKKRMDCAEKQQFTVEGAEVQDVRLEKEIDDEGNVTIRQFINGEEVEVNEEDLIWFEESNTRTHPHGKTMILETEDQEGDGELIIEHRVVRGDGHEQMSDEELDEMIQNIKEEYGISGDSEGEDRVVIIMDELHSGNVDSDDLPEGAQMMEVEVEKIIGSDGEEQIQMWINGEEVDPADHEEWMNIDEGNGEMEIEIEFTDEDGENTWITNGEGGEEIFIEMIGGNPYTIAIVSTVAEGESVETENRSLDNELAINDLKFSPNPNGGQFNLSFFLPEKGRTELVIYDLQGKRVYEESLGRFSGEYNNQIDLSSEGPGTYILNILQGKQKLAEKIIVR